MAGHEVDPVELVHRTLEVNARAMSIEEIGRHSGLTRDEINEAFARLAERVAEDEEQKWRLV